MKIKTSGVHLAGEGRFKVMILGAGGIGKTRWASFWPKPFFAQCEDGMSSTMDRNVPYVDIASSKDMLEFLSYVGREGKKPRGQWRFETVVIDTLDSYQRKVKDEWVQANNAAGFSGWEAWEYLEQKMQQVMTRLLNLPFNVVVLVHVKEREIDLDDDKKKTVYGLRLAGSSRDWVTDDFDLIGRMGKFWRAGEKGRVEVRGLTFKETDEYPAMKDRSNITGGQWLEVDFNDPEFDGYQQIRDLWEEHVESLKKAGAEDNAEKVEEEQVEVEDPDEPAKTEKVVEDSGGGPVTESVPKGVPFDQLNRPTLIKMAKAIPELKAKVKGNTTKANVVGLLEQHRSDHPSEWSDDGTYVGQTLTNQEEAKADPEPEKAEDPKPDASTDVQEEEVTEETQESPEPEVEEAAEDTQSEEDAPEEGVGSDAEDADTTDGGTSDDEYNRADEDVCSVKGCTPDLPGTPENIKRLSKIKYRRRLCGTDEGCFKNCYQLTKDSEDGRTVPEGRGWAGKHIS